MYKRGIRTISALILVAVFVISGFAVAAPLSVMGNESATADTASEVINVPQVEINDLYIGAAYKDNPFVIDVDYGVYSIGGNVTVEDYGELIIRNSAVEFLQDEYHPWSFFAVNNGNVTIENSTVTVEVKSIDVELKLPFTITGNSNVIITNSELAFPGTLAIDGTSDVLFSSTTIKGLEPPAEMALDPLMFDENDDAPVITISDTANVVFEDSRVEDYYEQSYLLSLPTIYRPEVTTPDVVTELLSQDGSTYTQSSFEEFTINQFETADYDFAMTVSTTLNIIYNTNQNYTNSTNKQMSVVQSGVGPIANFTIDPYYTAGDYNLITVDLPGVTTLSEIGDISTFFTFGAAGAPEVNFDRVYLQITPVAYVNMVVEDSATLTAVNTYFDVDWRLEAPAGPVYSILENRMQISDNAKAVLCNVTVNEGETAGSHYSPAIMTTSPTAVVAYYRWLDLSAYESLSAPAVSGYVEATLDSPNAADAVLAQQYNDLTTPINAGLLGYLNRTYDVNATNYNITDTSGKLMLPLLSDIHNTSSWPNADYYGVYDVKVSVVKTTSTGDEVYEGNTTIGFESFPVLTIATNTLSGSVFIPTPKPDLYIQSSDITWSPDPVAEGTSNLTIYTVVRNAENIDAFNVVVQLTIGGNFIGEDVIDVGGNSFNTATINAGAVSGLAYTDDLDVSVAVTYVDGGEEVLGNNFALTLIPVEGSPAVSVPAISLFYASETVLGSENALDVESVVNGTSIVVLSSVSNEAGNGDVVSASVDFYIGKTYADRVLFSTKTVSAIPEASSTSVLSDSVVVNQTGALNVWVIARDITPVMNDGSDMTSNAQAITVIEKAMVNLEVSLDTSASSYLMGQEVTASITVNNTGDNSTGYILATFTDSVAAPVLDNVMASMVVGPIPGGSSLWINTSFVLDPSIYEDYQDATPSDGTNHTISVTINFLNEGTVISDSTYYTVNPSFSFGRDRATAEPGDEYSAPEFTAGDVVYMNITVGIVSTNYTGNIQIEVVSDDDFMATTDDLIDNAYIRDYIAYSNGTISFRLKDSLDSDSYSFTVRATDPYSGLVIEEDVEIDVEAQPVSEFPIIYLMVLIIAAIAAVAVVVGFLYAGKRRKMVECGECGAIIPENSMRCTKCGTEFELGTAKCSECQSWIPADAKMCPECGVSFTGKKVPARSYEQRMRANYEAYVNKYKTVARRDLGKRYNEMTFQKWWREQPTFLTYQQWLKQEELRKKEGSVQCTQCGMLNDRTAAICHRCGSMLGGGYQQPDMTQQQMPPQGGAQQPYGIPEPMLDASQQQAKDDSYGAPPADSVVPKRVVKKQIRKPPM